MAEMLLQWQFVQVGQCIHAIIVQNLFQKIGVWVQNLDLVENGGCVGVCRFVYFAYDMARCTFD